jgi:hypothetical protein
VQKFDPHRSLAAARSTRLLCCGIVLKGLRAQRADFRSPALPHDTLARTWCWPWPARPVFGKARYINAAELRRRTDIEFCLRLGCGA